MIKNVSTNANKYLKSICIYYRNFFINNWPSKLRCKHSIRDYNMTQLCMCNKITKNDFTVIADLICISVKLLLLSKMLMVTASNNRVTQRTDKTVSFSSLY